MNSSLQLKPVKLDIWSSIQKNQIKKKKKIEQFIEHLEQYKK